jgi:putative DNA methylase
MSNIRSPKKLIEVALPLDDINVASAREKSIRHGHPSTLHLWWARRPLAAARAVIFAQMVNDPGGERGYYAGKTKAQADAERERLFELMRELVQWENTNNPDVLARARAEITKSWRETCELNKGKPGFDPEQLPAFHDPFAGGGALPLEAQRLGLQSFASDLNPVAVTINKAMIEIPPKFAGRAPVGPVVEGERGTKKANQDWTTTWTGAQGLAEDVRRYGAWMREQALQRIGQLYPSVTVTADMLAANEAGLDTNGHKRHFNQGLAGLQAGQPLTVIAWLWARTVKSPNPAFSHVDVPLASSFMLSSKPGKEAYVLPVVADDSYRFEVRTGVPPADAKNGTKLARGANFRCVMSDAPIEPKYIYAEAKAGRMGAKLMAIVAEGQRGRVYFSPSFVHEDRAAQAKPAWKPEVAMPNNPRWFSPPAYGMATYGDLFTPRQLVALTTFSDLVAEAIARVRADALDAGMPDDGRGLDAGGSGATAYAEAVGVYLGFIVEKLAEAHSSICTWSNAPKNELVVSTFRRQALPMTWDFGEANPFAESSGSFAKTGEAIARVLPTSLPACSAGAAGQADAQTQTISDHKVISTDPPYYDNIGYADLSDFFYVWLRRSLRPIFPQLYGTLAVPKAEELIATPYRHGSKQQAEAFFLDGMTAAMHNLARQAHPAFPVTIYYAFKQSDTKDDGGTHSTGWETFLEAVLRAGFTLTGTWPMRTERDARSIGIGTNALASSIVLVCRPRDPQAATISRRDFQRQLREHLPEALDTMIGGSSGQSPIAPVDLAQAAIGPGMAIFSQYAAVLNQDGTPMTVHDALVLINREITDHLTPDAGNFDADTLFANAWFEQYGWATGPFGEANVLAQGKGTTVDGVANAGVAESGGGKVRLLRWAEYTPGWDPKADDRLPVWEATHHLIRALNTQGESAAGALLAAMPTKAEPIRQLAYHLYTLCERKKWADDARAYNELITAWHAVLAASQEAGERNQQLGLDV